MTTDELTDEILRAVRLSFEQVIQKARSAQEAEQHRADRQRAFDLIGAIGKTAHTALDWKRVKTDGVPKVTKENPYPTVFVIRQVVDKPIMREVHLAELRLYGRNPDRPYWVMGKGLIPLENDSWIVTHWVEFPALPPAEEEER